jgi:hypothetical protein
MFILDFDPSCGSGNELRELLRSGGGEPIEVLRPAAGEVAPGDLPADPAGGPPPILLLVLSPALLHAPDALLASLQRQVPGAPLVAVTVGADPERVLRLLELGVHDFIAPPLRAGATARARGGRTARRRAPRTGSAYVSSSARAPASSPCWRRSRWWRAATPACSSPARPARVRS